MEFEWDQRKDATNRRKHHVSFSEAQRAFLDPSRIIAIDARNSTTREARYFCFGKIDEKIMTVRFTVRGEKIRIFGAGYWREGRKRYEEEKRIQ